MNPRHSVFFDLDSTLLDNQGGGRAVAHVCQLLAAREAGLDADRLMRANADVWPSCRAEVQEAWILGKTDSVAVSREAWRRSLALCGCRSHAVVEAAVRIHEQVVRKGFRLYDDVAGTFALLKKAGFLMALITNGPSDLQRSKLKTLNIEHWFRVIVISGETGCAKPDAAAFAPALSKMGMQPADVWHVGDNLETDIAGARAAGLTAVWLNRSGKSRREREPEPHFEIATLADLPGILDLE